MLFEIILIALHSVFAIRAFVLVTSAQNFDQHTCFIFSRIIPARANQRDLKNICVWSENCLKNTELYILA